MRAKAEGREVVESKLPEPTARVDDLMAALEASLAAATQQATAKKAAGQEAAPRRSAQEVLTRSRRSELIGSGLP